MIDCKFKLVITVESKMNTLKNIHSKFNSNKCEIVGADAIILNDGRPLCKKDYSITSYLDSNKYIRYTKIINSFSYHIHETQKKYLAEDKIINEIYNKLQYKAINTDVSKKNNPIKYDILSHGLVIDADKPNQSLTVIISQIKDASIRNTDDVIYGFGLNSFKTQNLSTPRYSNKIFILKKRLLKPFNMIEHKICDAYIVGSDGKKYELSSLLPQILF